MTRMYTHEKYFTRAEQEESQLPGIAETSSVETPELPRCEKSEGTWKLALVCKIGRQI